MISPPHEIVVLRQGKLPPEYASKLHALADRLQRQSGTTLYNADPHADRLTDAERGRRMGEDVVAGKVIASDGNVLHQLSPFGTEKHLVFHGNAGPVHWDSSIYPLPITGPWRVYLLPTSRVVVGAEAWGAPAHDPGCPTAEHEARYRDIILTAQRLSEQDITILNAGKIPPSVEKELQGERGLLLAAALGVIGLALGLALVLIVVRAMSPKAIHWALFGTPVPLLFVGGLLARGAFQSSQMRTERVISVHGATQLLTSENAVNGRRYITYKLKVGSSAFSDTGNPIVRSLHSSLAQDFPLRCYLTSSTHRLIAIEPTMR